MVKGGGVPAQGKNRLILCSLIFAVLLLSGCDRLKQLARQPEIVKKQEEQITRLHKKLHSLELQLAGLQQQLNSQGGNVDQRFSTLESSLNSLGTKYAVLDSDVNKHRICIFHDNFKGVQRLDTDMGSLLVSLSGIAASGNRSKLGLNIGNPSTSEVAEFTLNISYGKAFNPSGADSYEEWQKTLKSINESLKDHLKPGQWNKIEVPLGKVPAQDVKYVTVQMTVDNVMLKQPQPR
jgi:outer membrane murein-binding lipoprotein Lpp